MIRNVTCALCFFASLGCAAPPATDPATTQRPTAERDTRLRILLGGTATERETLARELDGHPELSDPLVLSLCEMTSDAKTRTAALDAIEGLDPKLFEPVKSLATQRKIGSRRRALDDLAKLGPRARLAVPVLIREADLTIRQLAEGETDDDPFNGLSYIGVYKSALTLLGTWGDRDPRAFDSLVRHANRGLKNGRSELSPQLEAWLFGIDFLSQDRGAIVALGTLASRRPEVREPAADALLALAKSGSDVRQEGAVWMLPHCGLSAEKTLGTLKELKYAPSEGTQKAVKHAVAEIEGRVGAAKVAGDGAEFGRILPLLEAKFDSPEHRHALDLIARKHPDLFDLTYAMFRDNVSPGDYRAVASQLEGIEKSSVDRKKLALLLGAHLKYLSNREAKVVQKDESYKATIEFREGGNRLLVEKADLIERHERAIERSSGTGATGASKIVAECRSIIDDVLPKHRVHPNVTAREAREYSRICREFGERMRGKTESVGRTEVLKLLLRRGHRLSLLLNESLSSDRNEGDRYELCFLLEVLEDFARHDAGCRAEISRELCRWLGQFDFSLEVFASSRGELDGPYRETLTRCGKEGRGPIAAILKAEKPGP